MRSFKGRDPGGKAQHPPTVLVSGGAALHLYALVLFVHGSIRCIHRSVLCLAVPVGRPSNRMVQRVRIGRESKCRALRSNVCITVRFCLPNVDRERAPMGCAPPPAPPAASSEGGPMCAHSVLLPVPTLTFTTNTSMTPSGISIARSTDRWKSSQNREGEVADNTTHVSWIRCRNTVNHSHGKSLRCVASGMRYIESACPFFQCDRGHW